MEQCQEIDLIPLDLSCPDYEEISDEQLGLVVLANVAEVVEPIIPAVDAIIPAAAVITPTVDPEPIVDPEPTVDLSNVDDLLQSDSGDDLLIFAPTWGIYFCLRFTKFYFYFNR